MVARCSRQTARPMQEKTRTGVLCPLEAHEYAGKADAVRFEEFVQASAAIGSD